MPESGTTSCLEIRAPRQWLGLFANLTESFEESKLNVATQSAEAVANAGAGGPMRD
jgi:hypothetical protein